MATNNAINSPLPLAVTQGGQGNTTLAVNGILYGNGTAPVGVTAAGNTGDVLGGVTGAAPEYYTLTAGSNMTITPDSGAGTITFASTGGGGIPASTTSFYVYSYNGSVSNVTGDGTNAQVTFDTVIFQNGSGYNTGTGIFTAPATGLYFFTTGITTYSTVSGLNYVFSIVTTQYTYTFTDYIITASGYAGYQSETDLVTVLAPMNIGDTAEVYVQATGYGSKCVLVNSGTNFTCARVT